MKTTVLRNTAAVVLICAASCLFAQTTMTSSSKVNWITRRFSSSITFDTAQAGIELPSGRNTATERMETKLPLLVKDPLLSLYVDNGSSISDYILNSRLTFEQIADIIESGKMTPAVFKDDGITLCAINTIHMDQIGGLFIKQKYPYSLQEPIDSISSRPYSGIIIDARGSLPIQGEFTESTVSPCFFPRIWNEDMDLIYERDMMENEAEKQEGLVQYGCSDDFSAYDDRVGTDPLFIKASSVYGINRTDPVIRDEDALRILSVPQNRELLKKGRVVVLLDKNQLIHDVAAPEKDTDYYVTYSEVRDYFYINKVPGITVTDSAKGIQFSVDLKFKPDSPQLLPSEKQRIDIIADKLKDITASNEFTILVEGYTADVGKPSGQMNLSIARTRTVMNALIAEGLPAELFSYKGYGGTKPFASNDTEDGRRQNRRVDITARPKATYIQRDWPGSAE